jgi:hypothetical protein
MFNCAFLFILIDIGNSHEEVGPKIGNGVPRNALTHKLTWVLSKAHIFVTLQAQHSPIHHG